MVAIEIPDPWLFDIAHFHQTKITYLTKNTGLVITLECFPHSVIFSGKSIYPEIVIDRLLNASKLIKQKSECPCFFAPDILLPIVKGVKHSTSR